MVVLRLKRMGRAHAPFYRLGAMDQRSPRDGRVIEELGWYNPVGKEGKQLELKAERIQYWLGVGAQPSDTVNDLLRKIGIVTKPSTGANRKRKASAAAAAKKKAAQPTA